jgi:hypothetical protein
MGGVDVLLPPESLGCWFYFGTTLQNQDGMVMGSAHGNSLVLTS